MQGLILREQLTLQLGSHLFTLRWCKHKNAWALAVFGKQVLGHDPGGGVDLGLNEQVAELVGHDVRENFGARESCVLRGCLHAIEEDKYFIGRESNTELGGREAEPFGHGLRKNSDARGQRVRGWRAFGKLQVVWSGDRTIDPLQLNAGVSKDPSGCFFSELECLTGHFGEVVHSHGELRLRFGLLRAATGEGRKNHEARH